ncbi:YkyB family protein [Radiobacillus sp. PE A8.2]|uniref:YkyB family protein n=1 Tax=Radiobacillus sp. PE A8.2 TaxID=3380349 RepID=UPI00388DA553
MSDTDQTNIDNIAKALFVVNRHAKTAPIPRQLYTMKKQAILKLIKQEQATKVGLHFSDHPKFSHQHSTLLVKVSNYYFHIPPSKEDFKALEHLGNVDKDYRNPKPQMSLSQAKRILSKFLGWNESKQKEFDHKKPYSSYFTASSLGQISRSPYKRNRNY